MGPPTPFVPPPPYGAYHPPMPYGTVPGPNLRPVLPRPPPSPKKMEKKNMLAQAQKKVAEARAARSIAAAAAKKEIAKEAPAAPAPVPEPTPPKSKKNKESKKRKKPQKPAPPPSLPATELTVASAEAQDTTRRASADDAAAKRTRTTTTTTEQSTGSRGTYRTSCNSAQASRDAASQPLFLLQWQQGDPVPPPKRHQEQLGRVIAHAFAKLLKVPALQGRWYTAKCLANMLRQRHDFSDACEFDVSFMDQAIKDRFWMIGSDGGAYNQSGAFRFTKPIYWPGNREAVQVLFYHFTKPGRFGVDWSETPEDSLVKAREPHSSYKGWYEFFEKIDKMPAFFSLVQRSTPPDEVDEQIDVLREIAVERQQQLEERLNQTNEEMQKELEARTKEAKAKRAAKKRENWDTHEGRKLFRPRKNEKPLDALRRRMEILDKVINEYDGFRLVLSEEDLTEHDIMIASGHTEERIFISKQIFSVRHRATCLRLAYSFVLERMGEGSSVSFFSSGEEALRRMGLESTGRNKNRVTEYNVQFRDREKFPLTLSLPKGRKDRLSVPMRVQRRRRNNTNENRSAPASDDDDDDEEENTAIAKFMVNNRFMSEWL